MYNNIHNYNYGTYVNVVSKCVISGTIDADSGTGNQSLIALSRYDATFLGACAWYPETKTYELFLDANLPDESIMLTRRDDPGTYFTETYDRISLSNYTTTHSGNDFYNFTREPIYTSTPMYVTKNTPVKFTANLSYENINTLSGTVAFTNDFKYGSKNVNAQAYPAPKKLRGSAYSDYRTYIYSGNSIDGIQLGSQNPAINKNPLGDGSLIAGFTLDVNAEDCTGNYNGLGGDPTRFVYGGYNFFYSTPDQITVPMIITRAATKTIVFSMQMCYNSAVEQYLIEIPGLLRLSLNGLNLYLYSINAASWTSSYFGMADYQPMFNTRQIALVISSSGSDKIFTDNLLRFTKTIGTPTIPNTDYLLIDGRRTTSTNEVIIKDLMIFNRELTPAELGFIWSNSRFNTSVQMPTLKTIKSTSTELTLTGSNLQKNLVAQFPLAGGNMGNLLGYSSDYISIGGILQYNNYIKFNGSTGALMSNRLLVWLDADDATTITIATGVSVWEDKSGNGNNATQGNTSYQPARVLSALNSKAVIRFDNSDDYLQFIKRIPCDIMSIFFVMVTTDTQYLVFTDGTSTSQYLFIGNSGSSAIDPEGSNNGTISIFVNGTAPSFITRGDVYTTVNNKTTVNSLIGVDFSYWPNVRISGHSGWSINGDIAEVIIIPGIASTTVRQGIEGYLANKWGSTALLPAGHPYKSVAPTDTLDKIVNPTGINESNIDVYIRFRAVEYKAQCLWKSGNRHNGIAIGLTAAGLLTVYSRSSDVLTSTSFSYVHNFTSWYKFVLKNDSMALYDDSDVLIEIKLHGLTFTDAPESESIGAEIGGSVILGTIADANFFSGFLSDIVIAGKNSLIKNYTNTSTTNILSVWSGNYELPVEIVKQDLLNNDIVLWTKIPQIIYNTDTTISIKNITATKAGDTGSANAQKVWDDDYVGVYHMAPNTTKLIDSSANHYDGILYGIDNSNFISDATGYTLVLNGTDEYAKVIYPLLTNSQRTSVSMLFTASGIATNKRVLDLALDTSANSGQQMLMQFDASSNLVTSLYDLSNTLIGSVASNPLSIATPYFITTNYSGKALSGGVELFVDNVSIATAVPTGNRLSTSSGILHIGKNAYTGDYFNGNISELLISTKNRSAAWDKIIGLSIKEQLGNYSLSTTIDTTSTSTMITAGMPWRRQSGNVSQINDITGWVSGTNLPVALEAAQVVVTKNRVYLFTIWIGSFTSTTYTAPINSDGTLGTWTTGTSFPVALFRNQIIVTKNKIYSIGGDTGSTVASVYMAPINSDGTVGTWVTMPSLPGVLRWSQAVITINRVYLLGGDNGSSTISTVYTAPINSDGIIGTWTTGTSLPGVLRSSQVINTGNRVYLLGGDVGGTIVSTVYTAPINSDGTLGTWTTGTSLPGVLSNSQAVVTKNTVYLLGGSNATVSVATVYKAPINTDGTLGTWTTGTSLPGILRWSQAILTSSKVYLIGGAIVTSSNTVYVASALGGKNDYTKDSYLDVPSTEYTYRIAQPWNQQYLTNTTQTSDITGWALTTITFTNVLWSQYVITKNRVYILGGWTTYALDIVQTAPINSDGTLGTWTTVTSLPGALARSQAIITKNRVYLLGGYTGAASSVVYTAPIDSDGIIGTWTTDTSLLYTCYSSQVIIIKNRIYLIGGFINGNSSAATLTTTINNDGTLGTWVEGPSMPAAREAGYAVLTNSRLYYFSGWLSGTDRNNIYYAPINSDNSIGSWVDPGLTCNFSSNNTPMVVTRNKIYVFADTTLCICPINSDGTLGTWTTGTSTPVTTINMLLVVTSGYVHILSNNLYSATFSGGKNNYTSDLYTVVNNTPPSYKLDFTIPANTVSTSLYNVPVMLRLKSPLSGSLDTTELFRDIKTPYSAFAGTNIKNRRFGIARDGITDLHLPALPQSKGVLYENNGSMFFNGTTAAVVDITNNLSRQILMESLTVSLWVFPTYISANDTLIFGSNANEFSIHTNAAGQGVVTVKHTSTTITSARYITMNTWNHLVVVRDNTNKTISIYHGGVLVTTNTYTSVPVISATAITIGSSSYFGRIADIKIFNKLLNSNECSNLYKFSAFSVYKNNITTVIINKNTLLLGENLTSVVVQDSTGTGGAITYINGTPWQQQYNFNTTQNSDITGWLTGTALPTTFVQSSVVITKNRVYLCGGSIGGTLSAAVYTAPINPDGTLGTWSNSNNDLPKAFYQAHSVVTKNRVYIIGGWISTGISDVYTAVINNDGTLGTWSNGPTFPYNIAQGSVCVIKNRIYLIGGWCSALGDSPYIFTSIINEDDGTISGWTLAGQIPTARNGNPGLIVTKNFLYVCGGWTGGAVNSIVYAPINADGTLGTWTTGTPLPGAFAYANCITTKNRAYILAGSTSTTVYTAVINSDGSIDTWTTGTPLPVTVFLSHVIVTSAYIYVLSGNQSGSASANVYYAPFAGGLNDYTNSYYTNNLLQDSINAYYALSSDGSTYKTYNNATWGAIVSSTPAVHGYSENVPYFYDPDNTAWIYEGYSTESAISKAMEIPTNRMNASTLSGLSNFSDVFNTNNGNINLAISMYSDGLRNVKLTDVKINNKSYWVSEPYDLTRYCATVTEAKIYAQFMADYTTYATSFKIYCFVTGETSWTECTNNNIPNIPPGLITSNKYATFRVVWDLTIQANPIDISLELVIH